MEIAKRNTAEWASRIRYCHGNFSQLSSTLPAIGYAQVDGLLADLGVSRFQLTEAERGFSFMADGELDMRMDRSTGETAADLVNFTAEEALANLIYQLGEEKGVAEDSQSNRSGTTHTIHEALGRRDRGCRAPNGKIHPATKTFMALRMATNSEQEELDALLAIAPNLVRPGGRIVVITFMSLEDRKVKQAFQALAREGRVQILTKHVVTPAEGEVQQNPPSRSAKLRALEMK